MFPSNISTLIISAKQTKNVFLCSDPGLLQPDGAGPEPVDLEEDQDFEEFGTLENDDRPGEEEEEPGNNDTN